MNVRQSLRVGHALAHIAWVSIISLVVASCSLSDIPIEPAGAPSTAQSGNDNMSY